MKIESPGEQSNESLDNKNDPENSQIFTTKRTKIKGITP